MAPDMKKLRAEIIGDPLGRGYSGMDDVAVLTSLKAVLTSLKAEYRSRLGVLPHGRLIRVLAQEGRLAKIQRAAEEWSDPAKDVASSAAMAAMGLVGRDSSSLDPSDQEDVDLINTLVSTGVLTTDDRQALIDAATQTISRETELSLGGRVRLGDIQRARP